MLRTIIAGIFVLTSTVANAEWLYLLEESSFSDEKTYMAMVESEQVRPALGISCVMPYRLGVFLLMDEQVTNDDIMNLNKSGPEFLLRVDGGDLISLEAKVTSANGAMVLTYPGDPDFVREIRDAKQQIDVAMKVFGKIYHEGTITGLENSSSLNTVLKGCNHE